MITIAAGHMIGIGTRLLERAGAAEAVAARVSTEIVSNALAGHDSHGITLLPRFLDDIDTGKIRPQAEPTVAMKGPGLALVDGHRGFGQLTMLEAMATAIRVAGDQGAASVSVTDCNHVGMLWNYAHSAAKAGVIGLIWCVSGPDGGGGVMAPFGGRRTAIGNNPLAIGIPAGRHQPMVLDISSSAVAGGKVVWYAQQGKSIPQGWIIDEDGRPTTDPTKLFQGDGFQQIAGALLPMAGHKGFGLALAGEILAGILSGYGSNNLSQYREGNGAFIVAIDVKFFLPPQVFGAQVDALFDYVKSIPTDDQTDEILIPGEIEQRTRAEREKAGIPVTEKIWAELVERGRSVGIAVEASA